MAAHSISAPTTVNRLTALCAAVCGLMALALPVLIVLSFALMSTEQLIEARYIPEGALASAPLELWQRLLGCLVSLVPAAFMSFGLVRARQCLLAFGQGDFFARDAIAGLRDFAAAVFWGVGVSLLVTPAMSVVTTWSNPPGERMLNIGLHGGQVFSALYAAIFWLIAAAMARESEQFV